MEGHAGVAAADVLQRHGVEVVFTLSGGHIFPLYDGLVQRGVRLVDTRHEQTAAFAAEGWSKLTRRVGVAAVTAGPGVTNAASAMAGASQSGTPMLVIGGRAPQLRWGAGSLQEFDHIPVVASLCRLALTSTAGAELAGDVERALLAAQTPHRGPAFVDVPLDVFASPAAPGDASAAAASLPTRPAPDSAAVETVAALLAQSQRPLVFAGSDVYWDHAEAALQRFADALDVAVFSNGLGRGTIPADHRCAFSRARSTALAAADLVVAVGTPLDFRLRFGDFGAARVVHITATPEQVAAHATLAASVSGDLAVVLEAVRSASHAPAPERRQWLDELRAEETRLREKDRADLCSNASPIRPARIYGELLPRLQRDAVVIGDGGDFVSYAGRYVDTFVPGCFLDPGPFGCLGTGAGYAIAARLAHPTRQVVLLLGDGAAGFSLMDFDTMVRHGLPVVAVCGNNGIWGLEKHPMQAFFGYDVAADLRPGTRYDEVVRALGGHGELVTDAEQIGPALDRAFASGLPALVNVLTDPADAYPRSSNLV